MSAVLCAAIVSAVLLPALFWLIAAPLRLFWKLVVNALCGALAVVLLNLLARYTGVAFALNWLTAAIVAVLGLPGVGALLVIRVLLL